MIGDLPKTSVEAQLQIALYGGRDSVAARIRTLKGDLAKSKRDRPDIRATIARHEEAMRLAR